jgi:hypothetical protein
MVYANRGVGIRLQGLEPEYVLILVDNQRIAGRAGARHCTPRSRTHSTCRGDGSPVTR